jgi:hypothetical protein
MTKLISMKVPDDVLAEIDADAKARGVSRTALLIGAWRTVAHPPFLMSDTGDVRPILGPLGPPFGVKPSDEGRIMIGDPVAKRGTKRRSAGQAMELAGRSALFGLDVQVGPKVTKPGDRLKKSKEKK